MRALYRTVSALLAIVAGLVLAMLLTAVIEDREIRVVWFVVFAIGALTAAGTSVVLWGKTVRRQ
ncbi:MAG: hypothetical protein ABIO51_01620 [Solirubrobacteraceae bacterium]